MDSQSSMRCHDFKCNARSVGVALLMQLGVVIGSSGPIAARDVCSSDYDQSLYAARVC